MEELNRSLTRSALCSTIHSIASGKEEIYYFSAHCYPPLSSALVTPSPKLYFEPLVTSS